MTYFRIFYSTIGAILLNRMILWLGPVLAVLMIFCIPLTGQEMSNRPNFILIIADDVSVDDLGCYGNQVVQTPHLDQLATNGLRFTNAYLTTSSCSPSRTSIISGRYPHNTGSAELHTPLPAGIEIFPEKLRDAGYYTAQAGKWHMGAAPRRGFDEIHDKGAEMGPGGEKMWVELLQNRPQNQPFFLWLAALDAHRIWGPNEFDGTHNPADIEVPPFLADDDSTRKDLALYYDEIARLDYYVGKVVEELDQQGISENTVIVFMADNGRPFPRCKTRLYDSGIKTPFIIKWPDGIPTEGEECTGLISSIDLAPTILDLADVYIPESFQGRSFRTLLQDPTTPFRQFAFAEHNWHDHEALERMVRTTDYLYIINYRPLFPNQGPADSNNSLSFDALKAVRDLGKLTAAQADVFVTPRPMEELYDCHRDPLQLVNRAADPILQNKLEELRRVMQLWIKQTGDSQPDQLTSDWYSRESGDALDVERVRGEMPGNSHEATRINNPGPF